MMHPHGMHGAAPHHQHRMHPHHQQHPHQQHPPHHPGHHPHPQPHHPHHPHPHAHAHGHHQPHHRAMQPHAPMHQPPQQPPQQQQLQQQQPQQPPQHHMQHAPNLHRDQTGMLPGPIGQTGGRSMNVGLSMGVRMPHCPPPQPQIPVIQTRARPPLQTVLHRPPPPHILQQSLTTLTTSTVTQPPSTTPASTIKTSTSGTVTTSQQPQTTASSNVVTANQKLSSNTTTTDTHKGEILNSTDTNSGNSKEKTPMCLINELARYNKIQHQYHLTSEQGPAHRRRFTVLLRLGGGDKETVEEYTAEAQRIRAAQHAVAAEALRKTNFPRPPPRPPRALRNRRSNGSVTIMPTVELNALAMKLGEPAIYKIEHNPPQIGQTLRNGPVFSVPFRPRAPHPSLGPTTSVHLQSYNRNSRYYNQTSRFAYPYNKTSNTNVREQQSSYEELYKVKLTVGSQVFRGEGLTLQAARHDAAARALQELKNSEKEEITEKEPLSQDSIDDEDKNSCDVKSPVSMVHEIALKFNLAASFNVKSEKGPPHMKVFTTTCIVGDHVTEGEGNSKKISKKRAAEKMLDELMKLPTFKKTVAAPKVQKPKKKPQQPKKKSRNLIKEKCEATVVTELNPVSRLLQWANSKGGSCNEPVYSLVEEARAQWKRGFLIQCEVAGRQTTGSGSNKKLAKRNAAENMLIELGLGKTPSPVVSSKCSPESSSEKQSETNKSPRKVTFSLDNAKHNNNEAITSSTTGRQLVPGVLLMQDYHSSILSHFKTPTKNGVNVQTTATIAKELLRGGTSPTADALIKQDQHIGTTSNSKPISSPVISSTTIGSSQTSQVIRPKDQLLYLAHLLGFEVQFSDFPKGNHGEYLSLVTLLIDPSMVCHGGGLTTEQSHDQAARAALENLSQMGLDNVTPHSGSRTGEGLNTLSSSGSSMSGILTNGIAK